jgi:hypothetical protein
VPTTVALCAPDTSASLQPVDVAIDRPPAEPPPTTTASLLQHITNHEPYVDEPMGSLICIITQPYSPAPAQLPISKMAYDTTTLAQLPREYHKSDTNPQTPHRVSRIATTPRVFGLSNDSKSTARICRRNSSLMDGGANICVTGDITILVDTIDIPPMAISVAIDGADITEHDCCTKSGYTPLTCDDGSIYWQLCFYCANVVETIISPQAILASSDVFCWWTQTGFKDGRPGSIRFDSDDGHTMMHINLDFHDGLYYCKNEAYTIVHPTTCRTTTHISPPSTRRPS